MLTSECAGIKTRCLLVLMISTVLCRLRNKSKWLIIGLELKWKNACQNKVDMGKLDEMKYWRRYTKCTNGGDAPNGGSTQNEGYV
jgi:hypothetical protein